MRRVVPAALLCALACGGDSGGTSSPPPPTPTSNDAATIAISAAGSDSLFSLRDSVRLSATARNSAGAVIQSPSVTWTSSNTAVVSVSGSGTDVAVVAAGNGSAVVTARSGSASATRAVVVEQRAASLTIAASATDTLFSLGDTRTFTGAVRDAGGSAIAGAAMQWTVDKPSIATISPAAGVSTLATAVGSGSAIVSATSAGLSAKSALAVRQRVNRLNVSPTTVSVLVGGTAQLSVTAADARGNPVSGAAAASFTSSDVSKMRVSADGVITGVAAGSATVSVSQQSIDGTVTASVPVTVGAQPFPASADVTVNNFEFSPFSVDIGVGGQVRWTFSDQTSHNVVSSSGGPLNSAILLTGTYTFTFNTAGRFDYHCSLHPFMTGTVVVH